MGHLHVVTQSNFCSFVYLLVGTLTRNVRVFLQGCQARSPSPGLAFLIQWLGQLMFISPLIALLQELQEKSDRTEQQLSWELCVTRTLWSVTADSVSCWPFCLWIPGTEQFCSEGANFAPFRDCILCGVQDISINTWLEKSHSLVGQSATSNNKEEFTCQNG